MQYITERTQSDRTSNRWGFKSRRNTTLAGIATLALLVPLFVGTTAGNSPSYASTISVLDPSAPTAPVDPDTVSVELGAKFTTSEEGSVSAIRFYQSAENTGPHVVNLWSPGGQVIATATLAEATGNTAGWQTVALPSAVKISPNQKYVASYIAPHGRYSADEGGLDTAKTTGPLTILAGGGVFAYGNGGTYPSNNYKNSNYYVDVVFTPAGPTTPPTTTPPTTTPPTTTPPTTTPPTTTPPTTTPPTTTPPTTTPPTTTPPTTTPPVVGDLNLPRIPWEGGASYWKQFKHANDAGWSDPSFFPITAWYNGISSNAEAQYDKKMGFNTYIGMDASTPYSLFKDNNVYWIGGKLNATFTDSSTNWVGNFLDDEVDGRFTPEAGRKWLQSLKDENAGNGRFNYSNFTQMVMSNDMKASDAQAYVNNYTDAVSLDMYWYTVPFCSWTPYRQNYITPVGQENCRTASSYGKTMKSLRQQDAADGKLQAPWQFFELVNGGPGEGPFTANITAGQLQGAVMSSIINEARGLVYFNQSLSGPCQGGSLLRQSQVTSNFCGQPQIDAAAKVNNQIHKLASVLNTQSYQYSFGTGLDTMLKTSNGSAYVFAMIDGSSKPGSRDFQLPKDIKASSVEVVDENRSISVGADGKFTDNFANEYSYHIYKIG
ncbi:DUF4082 domain-containing protein [Arthrobacter sp. LAPM80]|uniref:DUF4082 domain-containing protein n=1 Tax=Arthrobacter sp. LAPM80 TaxID=3141788 RepID=UPI00398AC872